MYQEAFAFELERQRIPFKREAEFPVCYKGDQLNSVYRADFICFDSIVVELKALQRLSEAEQSQIINYLKVTNLEVGLLLNFGKASLEFRRFARSK